MSCKQLDVGVKVARRLLEQWGASQEEIDVILGDDDLEAATRVSHILNIHASLRQIFSNPKNINNFMGSKNGNDFFSQRTPLSIIVSGRLSDLKDVHQNIESLLVR
ncbi:hypothetical protein [Vibrio nigripulchritudo]|uniref:hypothetical protein n=1 Tax=Vibrio nigripulchritudo TaxID=28173 RepID=UPI0005FA257B|nr:hypothetical protein [Vibrio nigripulchritudo]KJY69756.1 hypothetical protein TW74_23940 [Vibrio nigripulchritudo]